MAQTYSEAHLALKDPTDPNWALAYARFLLRDKPNEVGVFPANSLSNEEIDVILSATSAVDSYPDTPVTYYRPHEAAALIIESDSERLESYSEGGTSGTLRKTANVARSVRQAGAWVDAKITTLSDGRITTGTLDVRL